MRGFRRADGRLGIRNYVLVVYLVECAHHVARRIAEPFQERGAQLIGFPGCYPSAYAHRILEAICTHPNTHSVLLVSLGCEEFRRTALARGDPRERQAGRASRHPARGRDRGDDGRRARLDRGAAGRSRRSADRADRALRSDHRHQVRRLRRALRRHRQSGRRQRLRPPGRCRRDADVRGDLRADRLRGAYGRPRRHARARRARSSRPSRRPTPTIATSAMRALAAATSNTGSPPSRKSRSAPMPRAARVRSAGC